MSGLSQNLLSVIADAMPTLSKSEVKVARVILDNPEEATRSSIAALATLADVSEPSVNRFCKKFGASGFPDFKLRLARSLASGIRYVSRSVEIGDDIETIVPKIFDSTISTLGLVRDRLNYSQLKQVVDRLIQAQKIYFFGLGASGSVAKDAEHKFFRFGLPVCCYEDILMQRMLAASSGRGDLFFVISYSGRTRELVSIAELARSNGATVISLTAPDSPLARISSVAIEVKVPENTDEYIPMTSRIVQLVILDVLATGVTLRRGPEYFPHLKKIKDSLKATRFPRE
jgi:RpiR family transcriptional regulator, carbohydrate utilization regulator